MYGYTSERTEWKYPFRAYLEAEYTAWPGAGFFPAALLICIYQCTSNNKRRRKHEMRNRNNFDSALQSGNLPIKYHNPMEKCWAIVNKHKQPINHFWMGNILSSEAYFFRGCRNPLHPLFSWKGQLIKSLGQVSYNKANAQNNYSYNKISAIEPKTRQW